MRQKSNLIKPSHFPHSSPKLYIRIQNTVGQWIWNARPTVREKKGQNISVFDDRIRWDRKAKKQRLRRRQIAAAKSTDNSSAADPDSTGSKKSGSVFRIRSRKAKKTIEEITCFEEPAILFWRTSSFASYGAKKYPTSLMAYEEK